MLEIEDLHAGYGALAVVHGVSLRVGERECVALIGPNGAGKTTVLRAVAGLVRPSAGSARFLGDSLIGLAPDRICRKGIGFVTEQLNLFPAMTVLENLVLGAYAAARVETARKLEPVFDLFPVLAERRRQAAGTLSGGERKMLAFGRALMSSPRLLVVDEPSLGLAPKMAALVFDTLRTLNHAGMAILLVEQNVPATLRVARRAYVLEQGQVALEGSSAELAASAYVKEAYLGVRG